MRRYLSLKTLKNKKFYLLTYQRLKQNQQLQLDEKFDSNAQVHPFIEDAICPSAQNKADCRRKNMANKLSSFKLLKKSVFIRVHSWLIFCLLCVSWFKNSSETSVLSVANNPFYLKTAIHSTLVENIRQINLFMQNKAKVNIGNLAISKCYARTYK